MLIAILGVIILIVGIVLKRSPEPGSRFGGIVNTVGIVIIVLGLAAIFMLKRSTPVKLAYKHYLAKCRTMYLKAACILSTRWLR